MNDVVLNDMKSIAQGLGPLIKQFEGKKILITGYLGFLGSNFLAFFSYLNRFVFNGSSKVQLTCVDNRIVNLEDLTRPFCEDVKVIKGSVISEISDFDFDYIFHCAGIASPIYYRRFPLETIEANAILLWEILKKVSPQTLKGFLYFSSSEIYGDPISAAIPTDEEYRGNVSCTGPRACYDESKRVGETISIAFVKQHGLPIKIVRPFNAYGPFMRLNDGRVIPDFLKSALENKVIKILSDGRPTRTFCYVRDMIEGCLRAMLLGKPGRPYNIGNPDEEISMKDLALKITQICGDVHIENKHSKDIDYLTDNPQRRCPSIERAKAELEFKPKVSLREGLQLIIDWYAQTAAFSEATKI